MREYLERIFPVFSNEKNGTANERTWHLYDAINFVEFFVFLMLRAVLETIFNIVFSVVKFGLVLFLTYAFAFGIFYYFDRFMPEEKRPPSSSKISQSSNLGSMKAKSSSTNPPIASHLSKISEKIDELKENDETEENAVMPPYPLNESILSKLNENNSHRLYPTLVTQVSQFDDKAIRPLIEKEKSQFSQQQFDDDSNLSAEQVVHVGSFRRPSAEDGRQSIVSRALADLANIQTKTNSTENQPEKLSIAKSDVKAVKSSNAGSFRRPSAENGRQSIVGSALTDHADIQTKTNSSENQPEKLSISKSEVKAVKSSDV